MAKIFHIIAGLQDGGAEGVLYRLCSNDRVNEHVVISLTDGGRYAQPLEHSNIKVICLKGRLLRGLFQMSLIIKEESPDIIQTWMYHADFYGSILGLLTKTKVIWNIRHAEIIPKKEGVSIVVLSKLCSVLSSFIPDRIICCADRAKMVHVAYGYSEEKMLVIPNGYDLERFSFFSPTTSKDSVFVLGMIARYNVQKDHKNLLHALSLIKKRGYIFECYLVGKSIDSNNRELTSLLSDLDIVNEVFLLGPMSNIEDFYPRLDISILSSSHGEGFPNVVAESMACGVPVVATDVGDAKEIIGELGWICQPSDSHELASKIAEAMKEKNNNFDLWERRRLACSRRINNTYSLSDMIEKYNEVWN